MRARSNTFLAQSSNTDKIKVVPGYNSAGLWKLGSPEDNLILVKLCNSKLGVVNCSSHRKTDGEKLFQLRILYPMKYILKVKVK